MELHGSMKGFGHSFMKGVTQIENNDSRSGSGYTGSKIRIRSDIFVKK